MKTIKNLMIDGTVDPNLCLYLENEILTSTKNFSCINLYFNTYGGETAGVRSVVEAILKTKKKIPINAIIINAHSAGYWIASACTKVLLKDETAMCGGIGVIVKHEDMTEYNKLHGVKITEIVSTEDKNMLSPNKILSHEAKLYLQGNVDYINNLFCSDIKKNRNLTDEELKNVCTGRSFKADDAITYKLADGYYKGESSMDEVEELKEKIKALEEENEALKKKASCEEKEKEKAISDDDLEKDERDEIDQEKEKENKEKAFSKLVFNAIATERKRISDIHSVGLKAHASESDMKNAIDSGLPATTFAYNLIMNSSNNETQNSNINYKNEQKAYSSFSKNKEPYASYHSSVEISDSGATFMGEYGNADYDKIADFILRRGEL